MLKKFNSSKIEIGNEVYYLNFIPAEAPILTKRTTSSVNKLYTLCNDMNFHGVFRFIMLQAKKDVEDMKFMYIKFLTIKAFINQVEAFISNFVHEEDLPKWFQILLLLDQVEAFLRGKRIVLEIPKLEPIDIGGKKYNLRCAYA